MGLFAEPVEETGRLRRFTTGGPDQIVVWLDAQFLTQRHLERGQLVFNIEGYGRFRLYFGAQGNGPVGAPFSLSNTK